MERRSLYKSTIQPKVTPINKETVRDLIEEVKRKEKGQIAPQSKPSVTIRLDPKVVEYFKANGPGWQTRVNRVLLNWVEQQLRA